MLLRESGLHDGAELDLSSIHGSTSDATGVAHAELMIEFAEACAVGDSGRLDAACQAFEQTLGGTALVDAAATAAIFTAVVRIADSTGIPLEPAKEQGSRELRETLDLDRFAEGRND